MIRRMVLSRTYQLGYDVPNDWPGNLSTVDPDNVFLARRSARRLDAEAIRDAILSASGKLDVEPPDRFDSLKYHSVLTDITAVDRMHKRAVYLPVYRGAPTDLMAVFNFPPADLVVGRREAPSVPTQALFLLNSPLVMEHSQWLALRLIQNETWTEAQRIERACELVWGRPATKDEMQEGRAFIADHKKRNEKVSQKWQQLDAWSAYCQTLFCAAEFRFIR